MNKNNDIGRALAMVTQLGISMLAPVILCVFFGQCLDSYLGWSTTVPLLILGILAGARNTWIMVKNVQKKQSKPRRYWEIDGQEEGKPHGKPGAEEGPDHH